MKMIKLRFRLAIWAFRNARKIMAVKREMIRMAMERNSRGRHTYASLSATMFLKELRIPR